MFQEELNYFIQNQDALVQQHNGKVLVLQGPRVIGVFDDLLHAYVETQKEHPLGTFMLQRCIPGPDAYTVTISQSLPLSL